MDDLLSYEIVGTFTKNKDLTYCFTGSNEIIGLKHGFTIVNATKIEIKQATKDFTNEVCIFIYKNDELIAKDFVFFFKDEWEITIENYVVENEATHGYRLKLNKEGKLC